MRQELAALWRHGLVELHYQGKRPTGRGSDEYIYTVSPSGVFASRIPFAPSAPAPRAPGVGSFWSRVLEALIGRSQLVHATVDVKTKSGTLHGNIPLIVEPRWTSESEQRLFVYHPTQRHMWFITDDRNEIPSLASLCQLSARRSVI